MALTSQRNTIEDAARGRYVVLPVAASTKIYLGALVGVDASGNAVPATSAKIVVGRADRVESGFPGQDADNSAGSAGAISIVVARFGPFSWDINSSDITEANVGQLAYAVDDHTVSSSSNGGARPVAGRIVVLDPNGGVFIDSTDQAISNGLGTLNFSGLKTLAAAGVASAGAVTLTGATVGQRVLAIFGAPTAGGAPISKVPGTDFEAVISVANEIQQLVGSLNSDTFIFLLAPAEL